MILQKKDLSLSIVNGMPLYCFLEIKWLNKVLYYLSADINTLSVVGKNGGYFTFHIYLEDVKQNGELIIL